MDTERANGLKEALSGATYNELVSAMILAQNHHARLKANTSEAWDDVCTIARSIIPAKMEAEDIQGITVILPDGQKKKLLCLDKVSVKTPEENKMALRDWLKEHDASEIISDTVNSSTLAAYVTEQMRQGEPYPIDICDISTYTTASLRKA